MKVALRVVALLVALGNSYAMSVILVVEEEQDALASTRCPSTRSRCSSPLHFYWCSHRRRDPQPLHEQVARSEHIQTLPGPPHWHNLG